MKIGYVCTNYNNSALSREAVCSLRQDQGHEFRIVVVDNHSNSADTEALKQLSNEFNYVHLILNNENVGYFRGLNLGIRHLRVSHPDIKVMVVGNNDLLFPDEFGETVERNLETLERYAVISPDIVTLDGVHQNPHVIRKIGRGREFIYGLYYANYYLAVAIRKVAQGTRSFTDRRDERRHDVAQEIYQGYGACYLLGPEFFRNFEELWAPTFMMHEEYFLSKQLSDRGMRAYYQPDIKVLHRCRGATGKIGSRKIWEIARDAQKIYRQHVKIF